MSDLLLTPEQRFQKEIEERRKIDGVELSVLNLGPTHPATHGIFQNILLMDGEKIIDGEGTVGISTELLRKSLRIVRSIK